MLFGSAVYGQMDTNLLPNLAPPYGELPESFWEQHNVMIFAGGPVLLAVVVLLLFVRLRPALPVLLPPAVAARQALAACSSRIEDGTLLSEVSRILRRYAAAAFNLPPGEATTAEFCAQLSANKMAGPELAETFARFLRESDERKFAPLPAAAPLNAVARCLDLIELAEARRAEVAPATEARKTAVTP